MVHTLFILIGVFTFLTIFSLMFAIKGKQNRNRLVEIYKNHPVNEKKKSTWSYELARMWNIHKQSAVLSYDRAFIIAIGTAGVVFLFTYLFLGLLLGLAISFCAFGIAPSLVNTYMKSKRISVFKENLEGAAEILIGSISAGLSFQDAVKEVARTAPAGPLRKEFLIIYHQLADLKMSEKEAFAELAVRIPCQEAEELRDAVDLYQQIGGVKAMDLLKSVVENLRKSSSAKYEVQQYYKSTKTTAYLVGVTPVAYFFLLMGISSDTANVLITTDLGHLALMMSGLIFAGGVYMLYAILHDIDEF